MPYRIQRLFLMFTIVALVATPQAAFGFQKFKLGNGALLRKVFGKEEESDRKDDDKKPEKADAEKKSLWPTAKPSATENTRSSFDQTRRRLEEDAKRLQEDLRNKFKSPFQNAEKPETPEDRYDRGLQSQSGTRSPYSQARQNSHVGQSQGMKSVMERANAGQHPSLNRNESANGNEAFGYGRDPKSMQQINPYVASGRTPRDAGPMNQPRLPAANSGLSQSLPSRLADDLPATATGTNVSGPGFGVIGRAAAGGGIQITDVRPGSIADGVGVRRGDVLKSVAGLELSAVEEIDAITNVLQEDDQFEVFYTRNGQAITKTLSGQMVRKSNVANRLSSPATEAALPLGNGQTAGLALPAPEQPVNRVAAKALSQSQLQVQRLQQQLEQQQATIRNLRNQLQQQETVEVPSTGTAPPELESDFGLELNLEPPR